MSQKVWRLYVDGASRGNPGPAGAGIYVLHNKEVVAKRGYYLGKKTNNEAEYLALLIGILVVKKLASPGDVIEVRSDSLLLIKQMLGEYRVRKPELQVLYQLVTKYIQPYVCSFAHVYREDNAHADALANVGVDSKISLPLSFITMLRTHEIHI